MKERQGRQYIYDAQKNIKLKEKRGIDFDEIIALMENGKVIDVVKHHNQAKYAEQKIYLIDVEGYIHMVPFEENNQVIYLKTIFPSRKATKRYLGG